MIKSHEDIDKAIEKELEKLSQPKGRFNQLLSKIRRK